MIDQKGVQLNHVGSNAKGKQAGLVLQYVAPTRLVRSALDLNLWTVGFLELAGFIWLLFPATPSILGVSRSSYRPRGFIDYHASLKSVPRSGLIG